MRKVTTKAVAVVLHNVCGAKNNSPFMVVLKFGSLLSSSKFLAQTNAQISTWVFKEVLADLRIGEVVKCQHSEGKQSKNELATKKCKSLFRNSDLKQRP